MRGTVLGLGWGAWEGKRVSQTKGRHEPNEAGSAMHDTQPGIPEVELKQTLPTAASFHATWRMQSMTPSAQAPEHQESGVHALGASASPPAPDPAHVETQSREAAKTQPIPPRSRPRALLAQTLQMPLIVAPVPPEEAETFRPRPAAKRPASSAPPGWQSVQRVGDVVDTEGYTQAARPQATRTEPMMEPPPGAGPRSVPPPLPPRGGLRPPGADPHDAEPLTHGRNSDYGRVTLPNAVRVPELSGREWMFIGLLLCASAATLYSLLVDDVSPEVEEQLDTAAAAEHVVTPAGAARQANTHAPSAAAATPASAARPAAATTAQPAPAPAAAAPQPSAAAEKTTAIITDPPEAELLLGGAVVGNTPAKVTRSALTTDYLLRKVGYEPQVVRVSPNSPDTITVTLHSRNSLPE